MLNKNMDTNIDTNMDSKNDLYYLGNNYLNLGSLNTNNKAINVILYNINKSAEIPFLNFILQKKEKTLNPIKYKFLDYSTPFKIQENIVKNIDFINNVIYKGYFIYNSEVYLFYEYDIKNNINYNFNKSLYVEVIVSEIVNYNKCFDYLINNKLVELFLNNKLLNYLEYKNNILEVPEIYYKYHDDYSMYNIIYDDYKLNHNDYYEFYPIDSLNKNKRKYVIKYVIFTGYTNITNNKYINVDEKIYDSILYINSKTKFKIINIKTFNQIYLKSVYKMF